MFATLAANPAGRDAGFDYVKSHWPDIHKRFHSAHNMLVCIDRKPEKVEKVGKSRKSHSLAKFYFEYVKSHWLTSTSASEVHSALNKKLPLTCEQSYIVSLPVRGFASEAKAAEAEARAPFF